jgi:transcriptional regulator with XRE-family HTH domain
MNNDKFNKALGNNLRTYREKTGMTQQEVADKLGVTKVAVHQWESGKRSMYAQTLIDYCNVIGVSLDVIFEGVSV